ncbi:MULTISPECIES: STM4504/CBY_0614 family protein [unclassified Exiguobacterium]|uniref:STM4504/CBY_0614 family protein n=1 Tax=unclassified Exiguobacterium TaxID=2644629 RepID=UPI001BE6341F|nr:MULTISPECIES: hypothetical protein [unclassified Exiguobacterium]
MLFSQRNNPREIEILPYSGLSERFRVQAYHLIKEVYSTDDSIDFKYIKSIFKWVHDKICADHALFSFANAPTCKEYEYEPVKSCLEFILNCEEDDWVVDIIELLVTTRIQLQGREHFFRFPKEHVINKLNARFKENGIGLDYVKDRILPISSTVLYNEAVKPALILMHNPLFSGALNEYQEAYNHYKNGDNKATILSVAKAFESTMKSICELNNWDFGKGTASALVNTLFSNDFLPSYYQTQLNSLKTTLEGLPTIRNKEASHGQGMSVIAIPDHLTQYALNLAGTNITFLIKTHENHLTNK